MKQKWHALTWKQKNILLTGALLLVSWVIYTNTISITVQLSDECMLLQEQIDSAENAGSEIRALETELMRMDDITGEATYVTHEQLLDLISVYCVQHQLILRDFPETMNAQRNEWSVETHRITLQGNYAMIVEFVEFLHHSKKGKVVSADFYSRTDNKTKVKSLLATIYVQCIKEEQL